MQKTTNTKDKIALAMRRHLLLMVALFMAVAAPLAFTHSAWAGSPCVGNSVCLYQHSNYGGVSMSFTITGVPVCKNLISPLDNQVSSVDNNTYNQIRYFNAANCVGSQCYFADGATSERANLALNSWTNCSGNPNDQISSFVVY